MNRLGTESGRLAATIADLCIRVFKPGIFKQEQLTGHYLEGSANRRKSIALDLYSSLDYLSRADSDKIQERMLRWFQVRNGVLKYTRARRFHDFDLSSIAAAVANFSVGQRIRVHDIGASDGRTSCEWYDQLNQLYDERLDFVASDYAPYLYVLKRTHSTSRLIVDNQQVVLQIIRPPFVCIVGHPEKTKLSLNPMIQVLTLLYARPLLRCYKAGCVDIERTRLELLCRECRAYIGTRHNFRFGRYDVLSGPTAERFNVIRVMNVLNQSYFPEAQLRKAVENIVASLREGGLFITGSNNEEETVVNGGIYKKAKNRLERIRISGAGSPVDALISDVGESSSADFSGQLLLRA